MTRLVVSKLTTEQVQRVARERLIATPQLTEAMGISRHAIEDRMRRGTFPKPIVIFGSTRVWDITQVRPFFPK